MAEANDTPNEDDPITAALRQSVKANPGETPVVAPDDESQVDEEVDDDTTVEPEAVESDDDPFTKADGTPFTRKDHSALQEALKKSRKEARDHAAEVTRLTAAAGGKDVSAAIADADQRAAEKWKPLLVTASARGLFAEAGLTLPDGRVDEVLGRAMRLLDSDALTVGEGGHIEGLKEQIEEIRTDFPELFRGAAGRTAAPRIQAADKRSVVAPLSPAEQLAARLLNPAA